MEGTIGKKHDLCVVSLVFCYVQEQDVAHPELASPWVHNGTSQAGSHLEEMQKRSFCYSICDQVYVLGPRVSLTSKGGLRLGEKRKSYKVSVNLLDNVTPPPKNTNS